MLLSKIKWPKDVPEFSSDDWDVRVFQNIILVFSLPTSKFVVFVNGEFVSNYIYQTHKRHTKIDVDEHGFFILHGSSLTILRSVDGIVWQEEMVEIKQPYSPSWLPPSVSYFVDGTVVIREVDASRENSAYHVYSADERVWRRAPRQFTLGERPLITKAGEILSVDPQSSKVTKFISSRMDAVTSLLNVAQCNKHRLYAHGRGFIYATVDGSIVTCDDTSAISTIKRPIHAVDNFNRKKGAMIKNPKFFNSTDDGAYLVFSGQVFYSTDNLHFTAIECGVMIQQLLLVHDGIVVCQNQSDFMVFRHDKNSNKLVG